MTATDKRRPDPGAKHNDKAQLAHLPRPLSRFSLGTAPLAGMFQHVDEEEARQTVQAALDNGVTYFDTAPQYGAGLAERRVGAVLARAPRRSFSLSTKVGRLIQRGPTPSPTPWTDADPAMRDVFDFSAAGIRRSLETSLERLGLTHVEIAYIHDPESALDQALDESVEALLDLRSEGLVGAIGVGTNVASTALRFATESPVDVVLVAGRYTLLDDEASDALDAAYERNVAVVAAGALNSGILASPDTRATFNYRPASPERLAEAHRLAQCADASGTSLVAAALQFPLNHPAVSAVLVGCRSTSELLSNLTQFNTPIAPEAWDRLLDQRNFNLSASQHLKSEGRQ